MGWYHHGHDHGLGRKPHPETPRAAELYPITRKADFPTEALTTLPTYKYWYEGGVWLDQGNTGTCVFNAGGHRYADSPDPHSGVTEALVQHEYVEGTGDTTLQRGSSGLELCRYYAKIGKISAYHWVTTPDEFRQTILTLGSVLVGTDWYRPMFDPIEKYSNSYMVVDYSAPLDGGHEYVINGINLNPSYGKPYYRMKNSWGRQWGHYGTARFECDVLEGLVFNHGGDAVVVTEIAA